MRTRSWIVLFAALALVCAVLTLLLFAGRTAGSAQILQDGTLLRTVRLDTDQRFTVDAPDGGSNTVTVRDGKIAVTEADCPDHWCMRRGWCDGGADIVCLPHRLVIHFTNPGGPDAVSGR